MDGRHSENDVNRSVRATSHSFCYDIWYVDANFDLENGHVMKNHYSSPLG